MKGIKSNEKIWVQYLVDGKTTFVITSNNLRDTYYLYSVKDGQAVKTDKKAKTPDLLEKWIK